MVECRRQMWRKTSTSSGLQEEQSVYNKGQLIFRKVCSYVFFMAFYNCSDLQPIVGPGLLALSICGQRRIDFKFSKIKREENTGSEVAQISSLKNRLYVQKLRRANHDDWHKFSELIYFSSLPNPALLAEPKRKRRSRKGDNKRHGVTCWPTSYATSSSRLISIFYI